MEFLVEIEIALPPDLDPTSRTDLLDREAARGRELRNNGSIVRIWRVPGRFANVGIWQARDATELNDALFSLPLFPWMDIRVTALATHHLERDG